MAIDPVTSAMDLGRTIIERIWPNREAAERRELEAVLAQMSQAHDAAMAQVEVNKIEAGHRTIFVAGWRPAIGWTGVVALLYGAIGYPVLSATGLGADLPPPTFIEDHILQLILAMLGFGGLRTYEKQKGLAK